MNRDVRTLIESPQTAVQLFSPPGFTEPKLEQKV